MSLVRERSLEIDTHADKSVMGEMGLKQNQMCQ